ncbi:Trimeric intracellular cation channel type 1B.1-like [Homarus americanus]|uniref:Trimeric intracellular cation channel type 1B.1-like n=1 Tax=Homarus americanus TaxID=6706 RepID=A0A8J5JTH7_HOMAM|nr:Trimeric intracellular cation channel type 1B.1-like [Homarus americanus]
MWYVIFYSPFDIGYKIAKFLPIKVLLAAMKEVYRVKKINDGNGSGFLKILERLMRGVWTPAAVEVMQPTFPTKASIAAALIFVLDKKTDLISAPHALVYFGICIFFVYFKLSFSLWASMIHFCLLRPVCIFPSGTPWLKLWLTEVAAGEVSAVKNVSILC